MLDICADLVFDYSIPEIICKIAYGFPPLLFGGARPFGQKLQLVFNPLENSETELAWTLHGGC